MVEMIANAEFSISGNGEVKMEGMEAISLKEAELYLVTDALGAVRDAMLEGDDPCGYYFLQALPEGRFRDYLGTDYTNEAAVVAALRAEFLRLKMTEGSA